MIQVKLFKDKNNYSFSLEVEGHSYIEKKGKDILCASVSILVENLAMSLDLLLNLAISIKKSEALYHLRLAKNSASKESELLFQSTFLGLEVLSRQFPNYLKVEVIRNGS